MKSYCLAPIGEAPELRAWRLRQFEDFFNPGGMATPDDTVTYEGCQSGFGAQPISFLQGYARGMEPEAGRYSKGCAGNYAQEVSLQSVAGELRKGMGEGLPTANRERQVSGVFDSDSAEDRAAEDPDVSNADARGAKTV